VKYIYSYFELTLFIYAPVYVTMRHADSPMYYFCHVIDYKVIRN